MSFARHFTVASSIAALSWGSAAYAFDFSPIVAQFAPKGPNASRSFLITNTKAEPAAIQIEVLKRTTGPNGEEVRAPDDDDFIVTPPQLVVAPGASQNIRVQWIGDADPKQELAYRLIVSQLPIPYKTQAVDAKRQAQVQLGYRYEAAIYVTPAGAKPDARLVSAEPALDKDNHKVLALTLESAGATRALLSEPKLKVRSKGASGWTDIKGDGLKAVSNVNLLAGSKVRFEAPWPAEIPYGPVEAEFIPDYLSVR